MTGMQNAVTYEQMLRRPDFSWRDLMRLDPAVSEEDSAAWEQVEIQVKYQGYIDRQLEQVARSTTLEAVRVPADFDYARLSGITAEVREKLEKFRPDTLGQASRISGVTPAAVAILSVALKSRSGR
jgi:tRNA uridine 5-carboxymethylaminomethyl modification enzyme